MKSEEHSVRKSQEVPVSRVSKEIYSIGPLGNPKVITVYLLDGKRPSLIDSGPTQVTDDVVYGIKKLGFSEQDIWFIALTHIHVDHGGGAWLLSKKLRNSTVLVPKRGIKHLLEPSKLMESARSILGDILDLWGPVEPLDPQRSASIDDNEMRELGDRNLQYLWAPGHASHHMILSDKDRKEIFAADAVGIYHPDIKKISPTTPPPGFDYEKALADIQKVELMRPKSLFLSHFQPIEATSRFFDMVKETYTQWYNIIKSGYTQGFSNDELMKLIDEKFPEYRSISPLLRKQLIRVDVSGYVDYLRRKNRGAKVATPRP